jgi:hypothetical protein
MNKKLRPSLVLVVNFEFISQYSIFDIQTIGEPFRFSIFDFRFVEIWGGVFSISYYWCTRYSHSTAVFYVQYYFLLLFFIVVVLPVCKYVNRYQHTSTPAQQHAKHVRALLAGVPGHPWAATFTELHQLETWAQPTCEACNLKHKKCSFTELCI